MKKKNKYFLIDFKPIERPTVCFGWARVFSLEFELEEYDSKFDCVRFQPSNGNHVCRMHFMQIIDGGTPRHFSISHSSRRCRQFMHL